MGMPTPRLTSRSAVSAIYVQLSFSQRGEHTNGNTGKQGVVQFVSGVLGGGADQNDGAVLDERKQRILLRAIPARDLVNEQQRVMPAFPSFAGPRDDGTQLVYAVGDGVQLFELRVDLAG